MGKNRRRDEGRMPRVLTREQIAKLSDQRLVDYRKTVLDRKQDLEDDYVVGSLFDAREGNVPPNAKKMPDGTPYQRGLAQSYYEGGGDILSDIEGTELERHRALTYLAWATDAEMMRRKIGRYASWEDRSVAHIDDPDSVTLGEPVQNRRHAPLRAQREGSRGGRRRGRGRSG
jgi:hypothetical protein